MTPPKREVKLAQSVMIPKKPIISIKKKGASEEQNRWVMEVYRQCGSLDAVYTVEAESGFRHDVVSKQNKNGSRDYYLFQFNSQYHKDFISSPESKNPYTQIQRGCEMWQKAKKQGRLATTWYGHAVRNSHGVTKNFIISYQ